LAGKNGEGGLVLCVEASFFLVPINIFVGFALQNLTKLISGLVLFYQEKRTFLIIIPRILFRNIIAIIFKKFYS